MFFFLFSFLIFIFLVPLGVGKSGDKVLVLEQKEHPSTGNVVI